MTGPAVTERAWPGDRAGPRLDECPDRFPPLVPARVGPPPASRACTCGQPAPAHRRARVGSLHVWAGCGQRGQAVGACGQPTPAAPRPRRPAGARVTHTRRVAECVARDDAVPAPRYGDGGVWSPRRKTNPPSPVSPAVRLLSLRPLQAQPAFCPARRDTSAASDCHGTAERSDIMPCRLARHGVLRHARMEPASIAA